MSKVLTKDTKTLLRVFGFRNEKDFVAGAVREKVRRLKALLFSRTAEKVRHGISRAGFTEEDIFVDFERSRRA